MGHRAANGKAGGPEAGLDCLVSAVPGYEVLERLGKGGMAEVYLARQLTLGRLVAIKLFMPEGRSEPEHGDTRFRREAELMARVSHPHVLPVYDFGQADGRPYLVMEYISGGDLRRRLSPGTPMPPEQVLALMRPVAEALAYLHRHGIIHRDLKPENILLDEVGLPRVADFGIAVPEGGCGSLTQTGCGLGTLGYVAPEQQYGLKVDERADQYSLAAVAYELLTGGAPLGAFKPPSRHNPRLGPEVDAVVMRALQESPNARYATIGEFIEALDRSLSAGPRKPSTAARRAVPWAALVLVAGIGGVVALMSRGVPARAPGPSAAPPPEAGPPTPDRSPGPAPEPAAPDVGPPPAEEQGAEAGDPLLEKLKALRARQIWRERGSPSGDAGEAVQLEIWYEAARSVEEELKTIAYGVWQERGSPEGEEGRAIEKECWREAQRRLYERLNGGPPPDSVPREK